MGLQEEDIPIPQYSHRSLKGKDFTSKPGKDVFELNVVQQKWTKINIYISTRLYPCYFQVSS